MTNTEFVNAIYANMLNSSADSAGLAYYVNKLQTDANYTESDMVAEFISGVLDADLTDSAFDSLTTEERQGAEERQALMKNKVAVSLDFIDKLGDKTNVTNALHPETDPAYLASISILSGITSDEATVSAVSSFLDTIKNEATAIITPPTKYHKNQAA